MNNYDRMLENARQHFLEYPMTVLETRPGVEARADCLATRFFGREVLVDRATGRITLDGSPAGFSQGLSVYDWLCDRSDGAAEAGEFCPVTSLPGILVSGSGLTMATGKLAAAIHRDPEKYSLVCRQMGGRPVPLGDLGWRLEIFPGLSMCLKFYFGDEEFPPSLTLLWDRNSLQFVRYETLYYIAGCLQAYLLAALQD